MAEQSTTELVLRAERRLLDPAVRSDAAELGLLLDESFTEIGQSGRLWTRGEVLRELNASAALESVEISESEVTPLSADLYLLTYRLVVGQNASRRSSIWRVVDGH